MRAHRTTRRHQLAGGAGTLLGSILAACGAPPSAQPAQSARKAPVTLPVWNHTSYGTEVDKSFYPVGYQLFKEQTGHTIDETVLPENQEYIDKLTTSVAAGSPVEAVFVHPSWLPSLATAKVLAPIDAFASKDNSLKKADFYPGTITYYEFPFGGKLYGLPYYSGPCVTIFNRSLCEQAGIKPPDQREKEGTWTWDGAQEFALQLTKEVAGQRVWGWSALTDDMHRLNILVWGYGGDFWDKDVTRTVLAEPAAVEGLQKYADFQARLKAIPVGDDARALTSGKSGNIISGRIGARYGIKGDVPEITQWAEKGNVKIGMAPIPKGPQGRFVRNGPNSFCLPTGTKHPEVAYELMAFLTMDDFQRVNMKLGGSTPPRKSQMDTLFAKSLQPWESFDVWKQAMELDKPLIMTSKQSDIQALWGPEYAKVRAGDQTARQLVDKLVPPINDLLRQAKAQQG